MATIDDIANLFRARKFDAAVSAQLIQAFRTTLNYVDSRLSENLVIVDSVSDFPAASSGVIVLEDNVTYFIAGTIDLAGDRLIGGQNTTIIGGSSENCRIKSTGLTGTALITSEYSLPLRSLTLEASIAVFLDAGGNVNQALDWFGVNFTDCATVGTVANYNNFIMNDCAFLNSAGLTINGTIGTVGVMNTLFDGRASSTAITVPSTCTISRRLRISYSAFIVDSGEIGIEVDSSATIPVEGYILDTVNFSGAGSYVVGVAHTDNKALFSNCRGIQNSSELSYYTMTGNATATTIASANVEYKVSGTTTSDGVTQKFTNTSNRATYTGAITRLFKVTSTASLTSGNNHQVGFYVAKNGTVIAASETYVTTSGAGRAENVTVQALVSLATNDYIEMFVENATSATDVTVTDLSVIVNSQN